MAAIIEVKFYNTFLLKKTVNTSNQPIWDGSRGIPTSLEGYPRGGVANTVNNWSIEESRIRGGYNNTNVDYGVKAFLVEDFPAASIRSNSLIYSGIFNSRTGINNTNVFSVGQEITKSADPANGSIQKLYAEDTNLLIFQESKVSKALIDKDAIYSAEGAGSITNINTTIGTIMPYAGKFGISKDPGSFAVYGYRKYFSDKNNNAILRLSMDGITEISNYGMRDYFRDDLNKIDDDLNGDVGSIVGGWDVHNKQYVISTKKVNTTDFNTLCFDEEVLGWTSFFTYNPEQILSLRNKLYTVGANTSGAVKGIWVHYDETVPRGSFYGNTTKSSITFVFNPKVSTSKIFQTINYEGSNGWQMDDFVSDNTGLDLYGTVYDSTNDKTLNVFSYVQGEYVLTEGSGVSLSSAASNTVLLNTGTFSGLATVGSSINGVGVNSGTKVVSYNSVTGLLVTSININIALSTLLTFNNVVTRPDYVTVLGTSTPPLNRYYAGFDRKENKYFANLVNNSTATQGEIIWGDSMSGIKGYFATVTVSTDNVTDVGGPKNLFAVSSNYAESSY
jgi:hypothetical protein